MATQTVDSLLLQTQVDDTGLTEQTNREIAQIERIAATVERVAGQLKPIIIGADTTQLRASLEAATGSVQDFFAGVPREGLPPLTWNIEPFLSVADQAVIRLAEVRRLAEIPVAQLALTQAPTLAPSVLTLDTTEAVAAADALAVRIQAVVDRAATGLPPLGWDVAPFQRAAELVLLQLGQVEERAAALRLAPPSLAITQNTTPLLETGPAESGVERLSASVESLVALARVGLPPLGWDIAPFETAATAVLTRLESIRQSTVDLSSVGAVPAQIQPIVAGDTGLTEIEAQLRRVADASEALNSFIAGLAQEFISLTANASAAEQVLQGVGQTDLSVLMTLLQGINAELVATGHPGFLEGLIPELTTIRGEFAATSVEAKQLQTIINALSQARLPALTAGGGGPPPLPPVDQFAVFRRETVATNATVAELTATMARGNKGNLDYAVGLSQTAAQLKVTNLELAESARRTAQYAEASRQASLSPFNRGLEEVRLTGIGAREEIERGVPALEKHARGAHQAAQALGVLAAQSIGVEGPIGRVAENLLLFSGGIGVVATVAGTVLALVKTIEFLATAERQASEAQDKLVQGLLTESDQAVPKAVRAHEALTAAIEAQRRAREGLTAATVLRVTGDIGIVVNDPLATALALRAELNRRANKEEQDGIRAVTQARSDLARVEIESLTPVLQAEIATSAQRERAVALLKELQSQVHALIVPEERRLEIAKQITGLQQGLNLGVSARLSAETQAIESENALRQQAVQADEQNLRAQFAIEAIIRDTSLQGELTAREEFFAQRRQLILNAARADESALRQRIGVAEERPITDTSSQIARDAEIAGLRSQLQLREQIKQAQLQQLTNEQRLAELVPLERVGVPTPPVELTQRLQLRTVGTEELKAELQTEIAAAIKGIRDDATQISFEQAVTSAERLDTAIHRIASAAGGLASTVAQILGIRGAADAAIQSVVGLVGSIGDLQKAKADQAAARAAGDEGAVAAAGLEKIASTIGIIQSGISLLNGLFGGETELARRIRQNSEAIERNTAAETASARGLAGVGGEVRIASAIQQALEQGRGIQVKGAGLNDAVLQRLLAQQGVTTADLQREAQLRGLDVLDDKGRIVAGTLEQLRQEILRSIAVQSTFSQSFQDQSQKRDLEAQLRGEATDGLSRFSREVEIASRFSPAVQAAFQNVDLRSEEAVRQAALKLFEQFGAGTADLGQLTRDEFLRFLAEAGDSLGQLSDSIHAVTDQTANIPRSFKQFQLSSAAEIAGLGPNVPQPPEPRRLRGTDINIPVNLERIGEGASLPELVALLKAADLPTIAQGIKAAKEKPAVITGNTVNQSFATVPGDMHEFARLVAIALRELGTSDNSSSNG